MKQQEWENKSYRDRVNEMGKSDIEAVLKDSDYNINSIDYTITELHRMQMANIDLCLSEEYTKGHEQGKERCPACEEMRLTGKNDGKHNNCLGRIKCIEQHYGGIDKKYIVKQLEDIIHYVKK